MLNGKNWLTLLIGLCYATNAETLNNLYQENHYVKVFKNVFQPKLKSDIKNVQGHGDKNSLGFLLNTHYYQEPSALENKKEVSHEGNCSTYISCIQCSSCFKKR